MAYLGTPPRSRVLSSADIDPGSISLDDISFTDQPTNLDITGTYDKHTMRLADGVTVVGDVNITDNLILSKISDDGNAITLTNDSSTRTITGTGSLEASTLTQTPNASLTGMTGELGSAVTGSPNIILSTTKFSDGSEGVKTNANGYVTKPNIPAFSVRNSSTMQLASGGANEIMEFDSITSGGGGGVNNGGHFNLTNYHFYPPIAGLYYFNVCLTYASSGITGRYCRGRIVKNGSVILVNAHNHVSDESGNDDYHGVAGTCITPLVVGDYIYVHVAEVTANTYLPDNMSNFVGWLLG